MALAWNCSRGICEYSLCVYIAGVYRSFRFIFIYFAFGLSHSFETHICIDCSVPFVACESKCVHRPIRELARSCRRFRKEENWSIAFYVGELQVSDSTSKLLKYRNRSLADVSREEDGALPWPVPTYRCPHIFSLDHDPLYTFLHETCNYSLQRSTARYQTLKFL